MTVKSGEDWRTEVSLEVLQEENLLCLKITYKMHLNEPKDFWNNVLWKDEAKVKLFGFDCQYIGNNQIAFQHEHPRPTVKHGGVGVMIWGCFAAAGANVRPSNS